MPQICRVGILEYNAEELGQHLHAVRVSINQQVLSTRNLFVPGGERSVVSGPTEPIIHPRRERRTDGSASVLESRVTVWASYTVPDHGRQTLDPFRASVINAHVVSGGIRLTAMH